MDGANLMFKKHAGSRIDQSVWIKGYGCGTSGCVSFRCNNGLPDEENHNRGRYREI
jgi:hypothetical protein